MWFLLRSVPQQHVPLRPLGHLCGTTVLHLRELCCDTSYLYQLSFPNCRLCSWSPEDESYELSRSATIRLTFVVQNGKRLMGADCGIDIHGALDGVSCWLWWSPEFFSYCQHEFDVVAEHIHGPRLTRWWRWMIGQGFKVVSIKVSLCLKYSLTELLTWL